MEQAAIENAQMKTKISGKGLCKIVVSISPPLTAGDEFIRRVAASKHVGVSSPLLFAFSGSGACEGVRPVP
jgi:hypothetical protein